MGKKQIIAVDIDDVLAAQAEGFVAYSNKRWGTNLTVEQYQEHWSDLWKVDHDETERRSQEIHESGVMNTYRHYSEAVEVLNELKKKYMLVIATSRRVAVKRETEDWLELKYPGVFESVYFAGIYDTPIGDGSFNLTKVDVLQQNQADFLIDDQLKHCLAAAEAGVEAILFGDYPWNQAKKLPKDVTRCKDWAAVLEYFDGRG